MTRQEFETWIEAHYDDLLKVARRIQRNRDDADDVLHSAVEGMLASPALESQTARNPWSWATGFVRGSAAHLQRSQERAESALGRAGSVIGEGPSGGDRAWFVGPQAWGQVGDTKLPRLQAPRPDQSMGENSIQPDGPCPKCGMHSIVRLQTGRDYDKWLGRERFQFATVSCLNGHSLAAEGVEITPTEFGSSWNNEKPALTREQRQEQLGSRFDEITATVRVEHGVLKDVRCLVGPGEGSFGLPTTEAVIEDSRRPRPHRGCIVGVR